LIPGPGWVGDAGGKTRIADGRWHHVAVTFGAGGHELFLDGEREDSVAYEGGIAASDAPLKIGISYTGAHAFRGEIDEVVVLGRRLGADEVRRFYATGGTPGRRGTR